MTRDQAKVAILMELLENPVKKKIKPFVRRLPSMSDEVFSNYVSLSKGVLPTQLRPIHSPEKYCM